jgi:hypothetical protein
MNRSSFSAKSAREAEQPPTERLDLLLGYSQALEMIERAALVGDAKAIRNKEGSSVPTRSPNRSLHALWESVRLTFDRRVTRPALEG